MDVFEKIVNGQKLGQADRGGDQARKNARDWTNRANELEQENARLKQLLARARASEAVLKARANAMLHTRPTTPLLDQTSIRFNDADMKGAFKTKLDLIWEQAHDKKALEVGIRDPKGMRRD